jgi:hypothetical protein
MIRDIKYGTYIFFAAFCALSAVWVYFFCPETKNKTLEEVSLILCFQFPFCSVERVTVL